LKLLGVQKNGMAMEAAKKLEKQKKANEDELKESER
jgi:hypothetical protein